MFYGMYEHTIDSKGRLTIPVRYRELLDEGAYITKGFDQNLAVYTMERFETMSAHINAMSLTDPNARKLKRLIFAHAEQVSIDKAGRILIPGFLREESNLENGVVIVGSGSYFEIWAPEDWKKQEEELDDLESDAERFSAFNLPV